jgi:hypothetical protein
LRPALTKSETLSQKYLTQKRAGKVTEVVEHLPRKCEALTIQTPVLKKKIKSKK